MKSKKHRRGEHDYIMPQVIMKKQISVKKRLSKAMLLSICFVVFVCGVTVYAKSTYTNPKISLASGDDVKVYGYAYNSRGISWWDTCRSQFYFDEEYDNKFLTSASEDAILATFPKCETYKVGGSRLDSYQYNTSKRGNKASGRNNDKKKNYYYYSDGWCFMSYGTRLKVSIPYYYGTYTIDISSGY